MFKKLLYINLFGITFLALFNYLVFHNWNSEAYLESFTAFHQRITNLSFQNIDKQIMEAATEIPQLYFSNSKQNRDILIPQEEEILGSPTRVNRLVSQMREIEKSYPYVSGIDIYYEGTQTVVTDYAYVHEVKQEEDVKKYLPWYEDWLETDRNAIFLEAPQEIYPTREQVITYVQRISQSKWKDKEIIVAIHILPIVFEDFIDEVTGTLVIASRAGNILYTTLGSDENVTAEILDDVYRRKEDSEQQAVPLATRVKNEDMTVFHSGFRKTSLEYVYYVQNSSFYADYNVRNRIFLMNFFISIFYDLLILASFSLINHYTYKKQVLKASKEAGLDIKEEKGSFGNSLSALTQEISTLNETVRHSRPVMFQNEVRAMILNKRLDNGYESINPYLCYDSVCTVIIFCQESNSFDNTAVGLQEEFLNRSQNYKALFTTMERGEVVAVFVADKENFKEARKDFIDRIGEMEQNCKMVIGAMFDLSKDNIKNSYRSASETARYRFIFRDKQILTYEDVDVEHRKNSGSHLKLFEAMEKDINSENFLDLKYHIQALKVSFVEGGYTIDYCLSTVRDLVSFLYQIMNQKQLDMWIVFGYDIREYYKQIEDIEEFETWFVDLCEVLLQNIRQKKRSVDTDMQARLIALIEENLENDISLDFLSDQFSMRPDVLSRLFKQMMGKGYTEYIKEKKLARALELIEEDYSMKDIAYKLGYNSPQYFIKIFKEVYGVTPYQYKKQKRGSEQEADDEL